MIVNGDNTEQCGIKTKLGIGPAAAAQKRACLGRPMLSVRCLHSVTVSLLSCLSVTLVYCGDLWPNGWMD